MDVHHLLTFGSGPLQGNMLFCILIILYFISPWPPPMSCDVFGWCSDLRCHDVRLWWGVPGMKVVGWCHVEEWHRLSFHPADVFSADVCGPDKELDMETCQCVCWLGHQTQDCGPNRHLDRSTCQCVCNAPPTPTCPLHHVFNKESCQCTCTRTCPRHQPLNKTKCSCECNESPNKCFLKGRRFHQASCR